jgi:hypothetical protein
VRVPVAAPEDLVASNRTATSAEEE